MLLEDDGAARAKGGWGTKGEQIGSGGSPTFVASKRKRKQNSQDSEPLSDDGHEVLQRGGETEEDKEARSVRSFECLIEKSVVDSRVGSDDSDGNVDSSNDDGPDDSRKLSDVGGGDGD